MQYIKYKVLMRCYYRKLTINNYGFIGTTHGTDLVNAASTAPVKHCFIGNWNKLACQNT